MENKHPKLQLRTMLPQMVRVNKPLVLVISGILLFIVIFAIVSAFSAKPTTKPSKSEKLETTVENTEKVENASLKGLPQGYNDTTAMKKYNDLLGGGKMMKDLQQQLEALKAQDEALQQKVAALGAAPASSGQAAVSSSPQDQQAKGSGLFFNGVAPAPDLEGSKIGDAQGGGQSSSRGAGFLSSGANAPTSAELQALKLPAAAQNKYFSQQNMQTQKLSVLKAQDNPEDIYDLHNLTTPVSPYEVQAGTTISAVLISGINTSVAGTVVAQTRFDIYDTVSGKYLLIPKGSRIMGEYDAKVSYGQRRVLIAFTRVIRPDGTSILIGKPTAADLQGQAGMEGKVDNHWGRVLGAATLSTILSVGAGITSDNTGNNNTYYPSAKQNAILGGSSGISQVGQNITNRALDIQPTITIPAGFQFNIIVRRDMVVEPFKGN